MFTDEIFKTDTPNRCCEGSCQCDSDQSECCGHKPIPTYDVSEIEDAYMLDMVLAGFNKEDVSVEVEDDTLTIKGERKVQEELKYSRKGSFSGEFVKSFILPKDVLADKIDASFTNGILSIQIPKEEKLSKAIEIK
jgi:HSP20 family protein